MDLAALVPSGASASRSLVVTPERTVAHWAGGMPPVFGTPFLDDLMEVAAGAGETRPGTLPGRGA